MASVFVRLEPTSKRLQSKTPILTAFLAQGYAPTASGTMEPCSAHRARPIRFQLKLDKHQPELSYSAANAVMDRI